MNFGNIERQIHALYKSETVEEDGIKKEFIVAQIERYKRKIITGVQSVRLLAYKNVPTF